MARVSAYRGIAWARGSVPFGSAPTRTASVACSASRPTSPSSPSETAFAAAGGRSTYSRRA